MMEDQTIQDAPQQLQDLLEQRDAAQLDQYIEELAPSEMVRAVSHLEVDQQTDLLTLLPTEQAAYVVEQLTHTHAADLLEELEPEHAAAIIDEMPSDEQADVLNELDEADAHAIITRMAPEEAQDARLLTQYDPDTAGGLMVTEYLVFGEEMTVDDVLQDIRAHAERYHEYDVQYLYVVNAQRLLRGVVRLRDLVLAPVSTRLNQIMMRTPMFVTADATLEELESFFDSHYFFAVPVVDAQGVLLGVVRRTMVEEAVGDRSSQALMRFGGIIGGEELRTMALSSRFVRRLAFLVPNILLSFTAVTIIAFHEDLIEEIAALAIFLPLVANLSGAAGNQAVAVSIRELTLGMIKPRDWMRVCLKEVKVGLINGLIIGTILGIIAAAMRPDMMSLALIVGVAYAINSIFSVMIGGTIPLIAKAVRADPAMISSPILTTLTDMSAFTLTLTFAAVFLRPLIAG